MQSRCWLPIINSVLERESTSGDVDLFDLMVQMWWAVMFQVILHAQNHFLMIIT